MARRRKRWWRTAALTTASACAAASGGRPAAAPADGDPRPSADLGPDDGGSLSALPDGIVELRAIDPSIRVAMMYATADNFLGRPAAGYRDDLCYLTRPAAEALRAAQARLVARRPDHALLVRDCYRPQRAVDDFVAWTRDPAAAATKARFYPDVDKRHLVRDGYIAATSTHTRGGTVDLTIVGPDGRPLDMGTPVDYFGPESHRDHAGVTPAQRAARALLRAVMAPDFRGYAKEWWHFTLRDAPPFDPPPEFEVARPRSR